MLLFFFESNSFDYLNTKRNQHRNLLSDPSAILGTFTLLFSEIVSCGSNMDKIFSNLEANMNQILESMALEEVFPLTHLITNLTRSVLTIYKQTLISVLA